MKFLWVLCCLAFLSQGFAASSKSAKKAARKSAARCLESATESCSAGRWQAAEVQARMGLSYDETLSDLWYILAVCAQGAGESKAQSISLLEKAFLFSQWTKYNRDNARLLYAQLLCETGRAQEALTVLDERPRIRQADAEFIRAKSYYRLNTDEGISQARRKINDAKKSYPNDGRFALVFFRNENPQDTDETSARLRDYFVSKVARGDYKEEAELEVLAAVFASGDQKQALLEAFSRKGLGHPIFAREALKSELLSEKEAMDYLKPFAESGMDFSLFKDMMLLLSDEQVIGEAASYIKNFGGTFVSDTDSDGNADLVVKFSDGLIETIAFDKNADGELEWQLSCDGGEPRSGELPARRMSFEWKDFPCLISLGVSSEGKTVERFSLVEQALSWSPMVMQKDEELSTLLGVDFVFPSVAGDGDEAVSIPRLLDAAREFEAQVSTKEKIVFSLLDGNIQQAKYYTQGERLFAQAEFEGNVPVSRAVDADGDGVFETTEVYSLDEDGKQGAHALQEERRIVQNLYGVPAEGQEFYLAMVQVDTNADAQADFTEEYLSGGQKVSSWDTDGDGNWNVRQVSHSDETQEVMFYDHAKDNLVVIKSQGSVPQEVDSGGQKLFVLLDTDNGFYWLSKTRDFSVQEVSPLAAKAKVSLGAQQAQGYSMVVEEGGRSAFCVRVGQLDFGLLNENESENGNESASGENSGDESETTE